MGSGLFPWRRYAAHVVAGTIFQDSRTSLQSWFYAIYLFVTTRHDVSGKELERTLDVNYKTAWRMGQQIRKLMAKADGFEMWSGTSSWTRLTSAVAAGGKRGRGVPGKTIVMGVAERGGRTTAEVIPDIKKDTLQDVMLPNVELGSTDELVSYGLLKGEGYQHGVLKHGAKEYAYYDYRYGATHHTNTVESFWKLFKASVVALTSTSRPSTCSATWVSSRSVRTIAR